MNRVAFFVDGFNLYHSLDSGPSYYKYKWLNLEKLARCFVTSHDKAEKVFYFTTYATWGQYNTAVIVSGDSDLIPAIQAVKNTFPALWFDNCQKRVATLDAGVDCIVAI